MDFATRYEKLNSAQKKAVDTIDGPVMVIAGPGTGKTELLSMRTANILRETDTLPENILCLTFTDSGASAMRERLVKIIGQEAYKVAIHTFHSFGTEVINQNGEFFYHGAHFRAADQLSSYELLRSVFDELEYKNPLSVKMNGEYTYMSEALSVISELKRSGLTSDELLAILDANDAVIQVAEPLLAHIFESRISKTTIDQLPEVITHIRTLLEKKVLPMHVPLSLVLADSLEAMVEQAKEEDSTKPVTAWRNLWMKKDVQNNFILKSRERSTKLRTMSFIYFQYLAHMQEAELYDFDDMILRIVHAIEVFPDLKYNLQEKYHYIMVDEFQDTNMAQMRILYNLTDNEALNDKPNILVVGDDDQAIYSFQGAEVSNINNFLDTYKQTALITLTDNYRSTATVLEKARSVVTLGSDRLEKNLKQIDKTLTAHRQDNNSLVSLVELPTVHDERAWLAQTIATSIKSGIRPSTITVLARRHHEILELLPYLSHASIKVNYERQDNVLDFEVIKTIEHLAHILIALFEKQHDDVEALLPELLSHPALKIDPLRIWRLSLQAQQNHQKWMEIMATTPEFLPLHAWLVSQSQLLTHVPLERMLDEMMGTPRPQTYSEQEKSTMFTSPFFSYYFSTARLEEAPDTYLTYLEALRTIRTKLREYRPNDVPTLLTFVEFIETHRELGSTVTSIRPRGDKIDDAINLMTAHKSKGLEFDTVYIIGAIDTAWGERARTRSRLISYPENLPLAPTGDTLDDRLRLFFVAMTRARSQLFISYSTKNDGGKDTLRASFLTGESWHPTLFHPKTTIESLARSAQLIWYQPLIAPISQDMRTLLMPILERYRLSSTHLNNFLDITRGGPQTFLLNNLLKFPQTMSPSASYGTAIHATLHQAHSHLSATGKHRPDEDILHDFEENLKAQHLLEQDFAIYLQRGIDALSAFLKAKYASFAPSQKTELNFASQGVHIGEAHLTGSLDLIDIRDNSIVVTDYKTGKAPSSWNGKTDYEKVKLHRYKQQLMFYNLLTIHSRDYNKYVFEKGILQFVEPTPSGDILSLDATFTAEELNQFSTLIKKVWHHITTLNLPDTSSYDQSYKGILAFERTLIDG